MSARSTTPASAHDSFVPLVEPPASSIVVDSGSLPAPRPIVKWAGGKTRLLPEILPTLLAWMDRPDATGVYHEPFVGGGAVFFALAAAEPRDLPARLADVNHMLISVYKAARGHPERMIASLEAHARQHARHGADYYYAQRAMTALTAFDVVEVAARFVYLNKVCFNGLFRVNRRGEFNVPMGAYASPTVCDASAILAASRALRAASISRQPFDRSIAAADRGDVVLCDPPYLPLKAGAFTAYQDAPFGKAEHRALASALAEADERGVLVMAHNADVPLARELYPESRWDVRRVMAARSVNSKGSGRGKVGELIVSSKKK